MERKTLNKKQKILVIVVASALVLVAAGAGIAVAVNNTQATEDTQTKEQNTVVAEKDSSVTVTVKGDGLEGAVTEAKAHIVDGDGKVVVEEFEVCPFEARVVWSNLKKGDYTLEVTALPVLQDGSTYKAPEKPYEFTVKGDGKTIKVDITLEKLPAEEMTQEQLEAAAAVLEQSGNPEAAATARSTAQTAPSVPGSASNASQGSTANNGSGAAGGNSSNTPSGGSNGGSNTPTDPNAGKTWSEAITHQEWVVTSAAWSEQVPNYEDVERQICNGCGADITGGTTAHFKAAGIGSACGGWHSAYITILAGYTTVSHPEEGYYKTVVDRAAGWY